MPQFFRERFCTEKIIFQLIVEKGSMAWPLSDRMSVTNEDVALRHSFSVEDVSEFLNFLIMLNSETRKKTYGFFF